LSKDRVGKRSKNSRLRAVALGLLAIVLLSACALAQERTAESWYKTGQELERTGSWQEAVDAYDQAINLNPEYEEAWCAKCRALGNVNLELSGLGENTTFADAIQACERALEIEAHARAGELGFQEQEDPVDHWLKRGQELYDNGSYEESTQAYEKAISIDPNNASAWLNFGESLILRKNDEALAALNKSLELNSQNADAWNSKGSILSFMNRRNESLQAHDKALEITNKTLETNPQDVKAWQSRAAALSGLGRLEEYRNAVEKIVEIYEQTLEANPQNAQAWWEKALYLSALGRNEEALQAYDRVIELNSSKSARAWVFKAYIFDQSGGHNDSLQAYDRAIELTPVDEYWRLANIWDQKGLTLQRISRLEAANEAFEKAALNYDAYLQKNPNSSEAWQNQGQDLYNLGRYEEALDAYDEAIESGQNYSLFFRAMLWNGKGKALQALKKDAEADTAFSMAKELGYKVQKESGAEPSSTPKMLAITKIMATGEDEFLVVANSRAAAQSLNGWTLNVSEGRNGSSNQSVTLPDL